MENAHTIDWAKHFDFVYCIHHLPQTNKLPRLMAEFDRVGLTRSQNFMVRYTTPSRYDRCLFEDRCANPNGAALNAGCINLGLEVLSILAEAKEFDFDRILILENDIAFLRDIARLDGMFDAIPADADIVQFDKFIAPGFDGWYKWAIDGCGDFFKPNGVVCYGGSCFSLSRRGIAEMLKWLHNELMPPDSLFAPLERCGLVRYTATTNAAIQLVYGGSISAQMWGVNSHHDGYARGMVDYSIYNTPDGYGYGSAIG